MMQPPNFSMPPPGFPSSGGFPSSDGNNMQGSGGPAQMDANQELWVETKTADGKVMRVFELVRIVDCVVASSRSLKCF